MFDIFKSRPSDEEKGKDNNSKKVEPSNKNEGSTNKESSAPKIQITDNNPYNKAIESAISEYNKEVDGLLNQQTPEYKEKIETLRNEEEKIKKLKTRTNQKINA